jgi:1-acyl-sn-glycerol-3-phosphate acyltransferase
VALLVDPEILERTRRLEIPWNRHGVDPYGARQVDVARMMTILGWLYRRYFTVEVLGLQHIPARGRAMVVGNHSGGWALDALMVLASIFHELDPPRLAHGMIEKFLTRLPIASMLSARSGQLTGLPEHALRLLQDERMLMVFPEGARGTAKLRKEQHSLVRFGTGFMRLAMQTRTPIVPVGFVGGGDAIPSVMNLYKLGRLLGVPYIPVTPYLIPLPLPVRLRLEYGEPMFFAGTGDEPDDVIAGYVGQVRDSIAGLIRRGVDARALVKRQT